MATAKQIRRDLLRTAEHALQTLRELGAEHAEVSVGVGNELQVSVRQGEVELVKESASSGLSVRVMVQDRVATSSTTDLEPEAVETFARRVVSMAEISEPHELSAPPSPKELARSWPDMDLFDPRTDRIKAARAIKLAHQAERAALREDKRITTTEGASFSRSSGHSVLMTSGGFVGHKSGTYQNLVVQAIADDEDGKKRKGFHWTGGRFFDTLDPPGEVGAEAARRAVAALGAVEMETGVYPIVFDRDAARAIIGLVAGCVLGDAVYRQRSYLAGKVGKRIASDHVTIVDDPLLDQGPGSRAFDGEGRKVKKIKVVQKGELKSYLLDTHSARRLKLKPTGSAAGGGGVPYSSTSNFYMLGGRASPQSLLKGIKRGLLVKRMMGFGFDATTGNFSRGAEGFMIEDGKQTVPVSGVAISRNLDEILKSIDRVANDLEHRTAICAPSFRVESMTVAGLNAPA